MGTLEKVYKDPIHVCIGSGWGCGAIARPGMFTCTTHANAVEQHVLPRSILVRFHFSPKSGLGEVLVGYLVDEGVRLVGRTAARDGELKMRRMKSFGVKVFGSGDLFPNVVVGDAVGEFAGSGYGLKDVHILSLDEIMREENPRRVGERTVVLHYALGEEKFPVPDAVRELLFSDPFTRGRVWANLIDADGTQLHSIELKGLSKALCRLHLHFDNALWSCERDVVQEKPAGEAEATTEFNNEE